MNACDALTWKAKDQVLGYAINMEGCPLLDVDKFCLMACFSSVQFYDSEIYFKTLSSHNKLLPLVFDIAAIKKDFPLFDL